MGWSFEVVHLSGFHRPDESREEEQREQKRERKVDVNSRHVWSPKLGIRNEELGMPPARPAREENRERVGGNS